MSDQEDILTIRNTTPTHGIIQKMEREKEALVKIINDLNQDATVELFATSSNDKTFLKPYGRYTLVVPAGSIDYIRVGQSIPLVRPTVTCAIAPISGDISLYWNFK